jgi:hypothetical protein
MRIIEELCELLGTNQRITKNINKNINFNIKESGGGYNPSYLKNTKD